MEQEITVIKNGIKEIAEIVRSEAHGGRVLLLTEEGGAAEDLASALTVTGVPLTKRTVSENLLSDHFALTAVPVPEGTMALVGAGGGVAMACAKGMRASRVIPRLLIPLDLSGLSAFEPHALFGTKGEVFPLTCEDARVLFCPDILSGSEGVREGLGILTARLAEGLDGAYEALILHAKCPADALLDLQNAAALLGEIKESVAAENLTDVALSWAQKGVFRMPASESAHLLATLIARKTGGNLVEYLFPAAYALLQLYEKYLCDLPLDRAAPPDRARNAELLSRECGLTVQPLVMRARAYAEGYEERMLVTGEYREDLSELLKKNRSVLSKIARVYRRTPKGEREGAAIRVSDLLSLLSLTGEAVSGYPLLRHVKMTGLLEPLLSAG